MQPPRMYDNTIPTKSVIQNTLSPTKLRSIARRRLARDLVELERSNILSVAAHPIDDNMFEWHVNIKPTDGIYCGVYFHLIMIFPDSYPSAPPTVKICTPIIHPNIFDSFLCLSMLEQPYNGRLPYEGWSSAYSVTSILMQLQSFLFTDKIDPQIYHQQIESFQSSINICKRFKCKICKHSHNRPWPKVKQIKERIINIIKQDNDDDDNKWNDNNNNNVDWHCHYIIDELWVSIFEGLSVEEIFCAQFVCKAWFEIIIKYNVQERQSDICCYYNKTKLGDDILGIGLSIKHKHNIHYALSIHSEMDILSLTAWNNGCRVGVWGEGITHFLPLVMNKKHAELADKAIIYHLQLISDIVYEDGGIWGNDLDRYIAKYSCLKLVDTLICLMNQMVIQFVMGNDNNYKNVSMIMCEKVILGYCALHHLLLYLVDKNTKIIKHFANKTIKTFLNNGSHKKITRDLGKLLIYLMISTKYDWNDIAQQFVEESFTRRVKWMMQQQEYAHYDTTNYVPGRLEHTFNACTIGRRLVMFQVWFMKNMALQTIKGYNNRLGRPSRKIRNDIIKKTKDILNSCWWKEYFNELDIITNDENEVDQILRFSVYNSKKMRYHRNGYINYHQSGFNNNYNNIYNQYNQYQALPIYPVPAPIFRLKNKRKSKQKNKKQRSQQQVTPNQADNITSTQQQKQEKQVLSLRDADKSTDLVSATNNNKKTKSIPIHTATTKQKTMPNTVNVINDNNKAISSPSNPKNVAQQNE